MKYKVGDRVLIKSLDWYNKNKDNYGGIYAGNGFGFWKNMTRHCGEIMKITTVKVDPEDSNKGFYFMENCEERWTDEMIEGLVEEESKPKFKVGDKVITNKGYIGKFKGWVSDYQVRVLFEESGCNVVIHPKDLKLMEEETKSGTIEEAKTYWDSIKDAWICPEGYIFKDENGNVINATKIFLEKKKKEYPKTCEECCEVLVGRKPNPNEISFGKMELCLVDLDNTQSIDFQNPLLFQLNSLFRLLMCRNAYWKIAGEEMGLGKPWKPDWIDGEWKWCVCYSNNNIEFDSYKSIHHTFSFPTKEMRDAFYENFKELIEQCKELL